jgi:hypothetical protein
MIDLAPWIFPESEWTGPALPNRVTPAGERVGLGGGSGHRPGPQHASRTDSDDDRDEACGDSAETETRIRHGREELSPSQARPPPASVTE